MYMTTANFGIFRLEIGLLFKDSSRCLGGDLVARISEHLPCVKSGNASEPNMYI